MTLTAPGLPPLSLYIHIPWCLQKCPYCDFNSHAVSGNLPESEYVSALLADLEQDLEYVQGRALTSIFIGGGTPSLFSPASLATLLTETEKRLPFASDIEITLEANPGTFEVEKFREFRDAGINRLSVGIQSFDDGQLTTLGRVHSAREAHFALDQIRATGFDNFNLDLMFGLPDQTLDRAMTDLDAALTYAPPHLSWYQLTIEPNTVFYSRPPQLPEDDNIAEIQEAGINKLAQAGLKRYEVSAYSQTGRQARHNRNYWEFGDYLGIGAGAHGKVTIAGSGEMLRTRKSKLPSIYLRADEKFTAEQHPIPQEDLALEFMMNVLRLTDGCDESLFTARTGLPLASITQTLAALRRKGLLKPDRLATSDKGLLFLNDVLGEFLDEPGDDNRITVKPA